MAGGELFLDGRVTLHHGDSREVLRELPDCSFDSVVTDPPYALVSIVKRFGADNAAPPVSGGATGVYARASGGFMGQSWDTGETAFAADFWAQVLRVLKPGGHVVAFSGTRTYHRMACAIEDGGFEIRDQLAWAYGTGFPKSHDVSKAIDKHLGAERPVIGRERLSNDIRGGALLDAAHCGVRDAYERDITAPASPEARQYEGWGTALKPAWEPICLARKPLEGTVASNVLAHGVGALNIDACRIGDEVLPALHAGSARLGTFDRGVMVTPERVGRWPANLVHDGSNDVLDVFAAHGCAAAARFFYSAKASVEDRCGSKHPTVKPVDLMQWLVRLITPLGGLVLEPFAGSGTTGEAAWREGMRAVLIERETDFCADIRRRMALAPAGKAERRGRAALNRQPKEIDLGPLFGGEYQAGRDA